jgi:hypothetical protein
MKRMKVNRHSSNHSPQQGKDVDKYFAARLLSKKDDVTIQEKEQVLENILRQLSVGNTPMDTEKRHCSQRFLCIAAIGAIVVLCVTGVSFWLLFTDDRQEPEFTAKGVGNPPPFFEVQCLNDDGSAGCASGSKLTFLFRELKQEVFFAALAIRESDNLVIWMFPAQDDEQSIAVPAGTRTLSQAVVLDALYPSGDYEIIGVRSDRAMGRPDLKQRILKNPRQSTGDSEMKDNMNPLISRVRMHVENQ